MVPSTQVLDSVRLCPSALSGVCDAISAVCPNYRSLKALLRRLRTTARGGVLWNVECGMWNVECGTWNVERGMWNMEMWNVECGTWNVERGMWNVERGM